MAEGNHETAQSSYQNLGAGPIRKLIICWRFSPGSPRVFPNPGAFVWRWEVPSLTWDAQNMGKNRYSLLKQNSLFHVCFITFLSDTCSEILDGQLVNYSSVIEDPLFCPPCRFLLYILWSEVPVHSTENHQKPERFCEIPFDLLKRCSPRLDCIILRRLRMKRTEEKLHHFMQFLQALKVGILGREASQ